MPRSLLILIVLLVAIVVVLLGLAALDREVPLTHIEQPITNAATR